MISRNTINRALSGDMRRKRHTAVCPDERKLEEKRRNASADFVPVYGIQGGTA